MRVFCALLAAAAPVAAADPCPVELRVKVALALAAAEADPPAVAAKPAGDDCGGLCKPFSDAAWEECRATGKPIAVFVGGCKGRAKDVTGTGATLATADRYGGDGRPEAAARIVVFGRVEGEPRPLASLPPAVEAGALRAAVVAALPRMPTAPAPVATPAVVSELRAAVVAQPKCRMVWNGRQFVQVCSP